jgi:hypothetical protein
MRSMRGMLFCVCAIHWRMATNVNASQKLSIGEALRTGTIIWLSLRSLPQAVTA